MLQTSDHLDLPIAAIDAYPKLAAVHEAWQRKISGPGGVPASLDVFEVPRDVLPYVMLLDLEGAAAAHRLRIRLAGTEVCAKHGREMKGLTTDDFFHEDDARAVVDAALQSAGSRAPSLAKREYISIGGHRWSYVRLILPLSRSGTHVDSFFKVADPASMQRGR